MSVKRQATLFFAIVFTLGLVLGLAFEARAGGEDLLPRPIEVVLWLAIVTLWVTYVGIHLTETVAARIDASTATLLDAFGRAVDDVSTQCGDAARIDTLRRLEKGALPARRPHLVEH